MGGQSVGVPGILRMLQMAHRAHGRLPWVQLFEPAITLAETGFPMSPRLHGQISSAADLRHSKQARDYLYASSGTPKRVGTRLVNQAYADTLRAIARGGADVFYTGDIARDIVAAVRQAPANAGHMTEADLANYRAQERAPVCGPYRDYTICSMGPPSSGGLTVLQLLGILQHFELGTMRAGSVQALHLFSEAARLAYADRELYMADADFVPVPTRGLLDPAYLKSRAALIRPDRAMGKANPGRPPGSSTQRWGHETPLEFPSTSHISIVDRAGNAVSMTATIEAVFGSRLMARGFLLNNQLTDFSFPSENDGRQLANRPEPGKRPRSSMAPVIVMDKDGRLVLALGSAGGSAIINYVAKTIVGVLDWGLDVQRAIDLPNAGSRGGATELEKNTLAENVKAGLETKGHEVSVISLESGLHAVAVTMSGLAGGADPRREGVAVGD
jgi:gamma-glutamyltranspeptidase/glutathione hydrolase